jgi:GYF domain 2
LGANLTDTTTNDAQWFYTQGGQRKGPVAAEELRQLLATLTIDIETPVWRKGMSDWQPLHSTEVGAHLKDTPPPISPSQVNNGLVWVLAVAPLAYLLFALAIVANANSHIIQWRDDTPVYDSFFVTFISPLSWLVPLLTNTVLCLIDFRKLKRAGYNSDWLEFFALFVTPIYLFARAQRLNQTPIYGVVWIVSFIVSLIPWGL